ALFYWARGHTKGKAQKSKSVIAAGQSHRLKSGGKAETSRTTTFEANALHWFLSVAHLERLNSAAGTDTTPVATLFDHNG
ncbi:MAG: hypothetical protein ACREBC_07195, partial [Pyrinomonadaceae bacterium]